VDTLSYKTVSGTKETANKQWLLVDVEGQPLGRVASEIARLLRGKHKTNFTPHADCGDYVVVINSSKVSLSGAKWTDKVYKRHTGFPGGQRQLTAEQLHARKPYALIERAVKGMLPKNKLGSQLYSNLYVYAGAEHDQEAQKPKAHKLS